MKAKAILTTLLLIIVVASVVMIFLNNNDAVADNNDAPTEAVAQDEQVADLPEKTTVYYFHGNTRCVTCKTIEKFTKEAVDQGFSEQVKNGLIKVVSINLDDAANEHFVKDYELATRCVVVSKSVDGKEIKWERLDDVWKLVKDEAVFTDYIQTNVAAVLKEGTDA